MQRLSAVDAMFVETETKSMPQAVMAVLVLDPAGIKGGYSFELIKDHFASRLNEIPNFRRRLVHIPFRLHHPLWLDDPDFAIDAHIHRAALPSPGGRHELAEFVADVAGRPLDRERPLWEAWVVEGLEEGYFALVAKTHHSLMDGVTGADFISRLFDAVPYPPAPVPPQLWEPPLLPSPVRLLAEALPAALLRPASLMRGSLGAAKGAVGALRSAISRPEGGSAPTLPFTAPDTPFNRSISSQRTVGYGHTQLSDIKTIKNAFGCTVNDVVLTACGLALRDWLRDHGGIPDRPLVATLPVSVQESTRISGNKVSTMFVRLPTTIDDPVLALRELQEDTRGAKHLHQAMGAETIMELAEFVPQGLLNAAAKIYSGLRLANYHRPIYNVIISNVPGPPIPLYMQGAELKAFYPHGPIFEGTGLNITVMSYQDSVDIGIIGCRASVQDVDQMAAGFVHAIAELLAAAAFAPVHQGQPSGSLKS